MKYVILVESESMYGLRVGHKEVYFCNEKPYGDYKGIFLSKEAAQKRAENLFEEVRRLRINHESPYYRYKVEIEPLKDIKSLQERHPDLKEGEVESIQKYGREVK